MVWSTPERGVLVDRVLAVRAPGPGSRRDLRPCRARDCPRVPRLGGPELRAGRHGCGRSVHLRGGPRFGLVNWALGAGLAGLAGILVVPIVGLSVVQVGLLLVPALAAALVGGFTSFPLTLFGGLLIGVLEAELTSGAGWIPEFLKAPGWSKS